MGERTDPRERRPRSRERLEVGRARGGHHWWNPDPALARLPDHLRPLADQVRARLFQESGGAEQPVPIGIDVQAIRLVVEALREAIHEAGLAGAPVAAIRTMHARLDREGMRLAAALVERTVTDSLQLLQDVSHDIRSPLNSILFLADTLFSEHGGELNDVQRRQIGVLYTASVTLVGLVNDLIDSARLGGAAIPLSNESFSIESALADVQSLVGPLATHREADLQFHLETVGPRSGDRRLLSRVLINLITNALQAVDGGGRVEVRVSEPRSGWLRVEVRDDGSGDDVEQLRALVDDRSDEAYPLRRTRGWTHGLGLTISSRLVRSAGGTIEVDSAPGEGTTFRLELPFPRAE